MEKGTKGEGAPRGQDESATGRNEAAAARRAARRSPRPKAARWGPRAAPAAGSPRTMFFRRYRFSVFILPAVFAVLLLLFASGKSGAWLLFMQSSSKFSASVAQSSSVFHCSSCFVASRCLPSQNIE
jgi:hypothetical protein